MSTAVMKSSTRKQYSESRETEDLRTPPLSGGPTCKRIKRSPPSVIEASWGLFIDNVSIVSAMHSRLVHSPGLRLFCLGWIGNPLHVTPRDKTAFARPSTRSTKPRLHPMCSLFLTPAIGTLSKSTASPLNCCISAQTQSFF